MAKYKSQQELLEAHHGGVAVLENLELISKEIQEYRKQLEKPEKLEQEKHVFRNWLIVLNKVIKQVKRDKNIN